MLAACALQLAAAAGSAVRLAEVDDPRVLRVVKADRLEMGVTAVGQSATPPATPATDDAAWRETVLPDNWDSTWPDASGHAWYRLDLVAPASWWDAPIAIYLPAVGMNAQLFINGADLGSQGRMTEPVTRNFYTPLLFHLPHALLRPAGQRNVLHVLVTGYPQHRNGLGEVYVGPEEPLRAAWRWRSFWQNTGTLISSVFTIAMGAYVLMLWSRERANVVFGWFGLAALVWGIRNLNLYVTDLPLSNLRWSQLSVVGAVGFVGFFALFTLRYCETESPPDRKVHFVRRHWQTVVVWVFMVCATLALTLPDSFQTSRSNFRWVGLAGITLTCWTQARLSALAWRLRTAETTLIALAGVVYIGLMLNDYRVTNDKFALGQYYMRQYAALPLFLAIGGMLTRRYLAALQNTRQMSESLATQVRTQHELLTRSFDQLRNAERDQAQAQERERLMRDLHDGLGLHLTSALMQARAASVDGRLLAHTLQDCLDDLRVAVDSLAGDERDPVTVLGSLRFRMAPRLEASGVRLDWAVDDDVPELAWLDAERALHLLRIVQEALTNTMRHSGATVVAMSVRNVHHDGIAMVEVRIADNGHGFEIDAEARAVDARADAHAHRTAGRGQRNMMSRAVKLGALLDVSSDGRGSVVRLSMPVAVQGMAT
ncbi:MAG: ATP-binding protein [Pseudomonadota bacterium]